MIKVTLVFKNGTSYIVDVDPLDIDDFLEGISCGNKFTQTKHIGQYEVTTAFIDASQVSFCMVNYPDNYETWLDNLLGIGDGSNGPEA